MMRPASKSFPHEAVGAVTQQTASGFGRLWNAICAAARLISFRRRVSALQLQESLSLGERKSLLVVHWRDRSYLLGVSPQTVQVLDTRDVETESASYEDQASRDCR